MLNTDIRDIEIAELSALTLRHYAGKLGVKGASKGKKADLIPALQAIQAGQVAERARQDLAAKNAAINAEVEAGNAKPILPGKCTECGAKEDFRASGLCRPCREFGEWENTHNDEQHGAPDGAEQDGANTADCPVCNPELDPRNRKPGRSRAGMVIVAKGTEYHKSQIFKAAAEAAGWTVTMQEETYEETTDGDVPSRYYATAIKAGNAIQLAWDGRAYDYDASSAKFGGKDRKVRNLKEALRLL
jgi:hypothetical protein